MSRKSLSHADRHGRARMVDVSSKKVTSRKAEAGGSITMNAEAWQLLQENRVAKGDVLSVARVAGIQAAKRTGELIPLCHPLGLDLVSVDFTPDSGRRRLEVRATARCNGRTGVEMEALTAAAVALLTVYDMCKAVDREMEIGELRLIRKSGGRSGSYVRDLPRAR
ncbi:MAG: cyclic pyranopterin monophosphate synthase MoaC [Acidobacteriota bacterium]|nr:cyclic pyranopterin monophosphate synthase MoaC [Acidobacteriota bacterium]